MSLHDIALIGFGEAGTILGSELASQGLRVRMFDRLLQDPRQRPAMQEKARHSRVQALDEPAQAVAGAQLVISAVTAGSALEVAASLAPLLSPGQLFMDINSVAPGTKQSACTLIEACGAAYVDAAVMAPVPPQRLKTPMLLGGRFAGDLTKALKPLDFNTRAVSEKVGVASAIKMCRSVMIKGLEALTYECLASARHYGVEQEVLASLHKSFPSLGWDGELPHYLISRIAEHGRRRSEEMQEVALTVQQAGVASHLSQATSASQLAVVNAMAAKNLRYADLLPFDWRELMEHLRAGAN
ncbi:MAG: NAD(P)-dependent oxidoreductase [Pseudomonas sp.]|nr:NAD(P)-dependent oxidoreductase [Pseudomonas sp.]MPT17281.1 NAD(P)-dependent oxidoreductase [Pseudomonas sp.]